MAVAGPYSENPFLPSLCLLQLLDWQSSGVQEGGCKLGDDEPTAVSQYFLGDIFTEVESEWTLQGCWARRTRRQEETCLPFNNSVFKFIYSHSCFLFRNVVANCAGKTWLFPVSASTLNMYSLISIMRTNNECAKCIQVACEYVNYKMYSFVFFSVSF